MTARKAPASRKLTAHPDLDQLRRQAKELLSAFRAGDADAVAEVRARYHDANHERFALHDAQLVRRPEIANMEVAGDDEHRAIHYAVLDRLPDMVRLLMRRGADARCGIYPHRDATTALVIARDRGYDEIVSIILEEEATRTPAAEPERDSKQPEGALTAAVTTNRPKLNPLHFCATHGKLAMAKILLEAGADPNLQVYSGGSAVFRAYMSGNAEMIALLERYGGVVDGITVGILGLEETARRLLAAEQSGTLDPRAFGWPVGPDSRIADELLWGAAGAGQPHIVRLCLAHIDQPREAPYWYTMLREPMYIGRNSSEARRDAMLECFRLLLERADLSVHGDRSRGWVGGRTLLHDLAADRHEMAAEDRLTIATMLLDAGARLDIRDDLLTRLLRG